jgi:MoaA/NifB/PqqE/SkfB family radical SAM enzyme
LIIDSKMEIHWQSFAMFRREMSYRIFKKMKKSGCDVLIFGLESGSDKVLKLMKKLTGVKTAEKNLSYAKKAGITSHVSFIVGFPGETEEDFKKTLDFIEKNKDNIGCVGSINVFRIENPSEVYNNPQKFGVIPSATNPRWWLKWEDIYGSNFEIRKKRVLSLVNKVEELGIKFTREFLFLFDGENKGINQKIIQNRYEPKSNMKKIEKNKLIKYVRSVILNIKKITSSDDFNKVKQIIKKNTPIPKYITIDLTNSCNLNCVGCWTHSPLLKDKEASKEWKSNMIPFEKLKNLINDLKELGTEKIRLTGGGEPFMHPRIMDIIRIIKEKGISCDITTNFTLLNKDKIKKLFELNVDEIVVSLWAGDAETYVKIHPNQTKKTFERIKDNLEFIAQYKEKIRKGPKVIMANVISNINYDKVDKIANFATHVSLDEIYFTLIDPIKD